MAKISDVDFFNGNREVSEPSIVITARCARAAIDLGELDDLLEKALNALDVTGKHIVFVDAA